MNMHWELLAYQHHPDKFSTCVENCNCAVMHLMLPHAHVVEYKSMKTIQCI